MRMTYEMSSRTLQRILWQDPVYLNCRRCAGPVSWETARVVELSDDEAVVEHYRCEEAG